MSEDHTLPFENRNLFSNHFLENLLPSFREWSEGTPQAIFEEIKQRYEAEKPFLTRQLREAPLEERFFRPILKALGFVYEVQAGVEEGLELPDYALFAERADLDKAYRGGQAFYDRAIAVGEVKRWGTELGRFGKDRYNRSLNPSYQIKSYLSLAKPQWGILSNGREWRLYHEHRPMASYYEVDLVELLENDDVDGFRYFYYFFRKDAFLPHVDAESFLDRVLTGSEEYARAVGENLKENVYRALRIIAQGFFDFPENGLNPSNEADVQRVQKNVLRLLYRILFVLYAEGKGLLGDRAYLRSTYSVHSLKHEIAERKDQGEVFLPGGGAYWTRVRELFSLIDRGSQDFGIPKDQFYVPPYNGRLFDSTQNEFLETKKIGDYPLAEAIDLLARTSTRKGPKGFVDYSTLDIRHLGGIYEGLLEYRIQVAVEPMVVVGGKRRWSMYEGYKKGRARPIPFSDFSIWDRADVGAIYVSTHRGERKATGSYYTPDHIVRHIIDCSVGPVVREKWKEATELDQSRAESVLSIRVLDPAMGSGHFLVEVTEYLAGKLLEGVKEDVKLGLLSAEQVAEYTEDWAKRRVVSRCVYGVDLNDLAVELAKVSLWLTTISKDKPLSFLDHHLKCGNSLIGSEIVDLGWLPFQRPAGVERKIDEPFGLLEVLIGRLREIESIPDDNRDAVKRKERIFDRLRDSQEYRRIKALADVHAGLPFVKYDPERIRSGYMELANEALYGNPDKWERKFSLSWSQEARMKAEERRAFHWELEFPEVFHETVSESDGGGFDVVLGNPPYLNVKRGALARDKVYLEKAFDLANGQWDTFALFFELGIHLVRKDGFWSMIIPKPALSSENYEALRSQWLNEFDLRLVSDAGTPFADPAVESVVAVVRKSSPDDPRFTVYQVSDGGVQRLWEVDKAFSRTNPFTIISIRLDDKTLQVLSKFSSRDSTLADFFPTITRGIEAGKNAKFIQDLGTATYPLIFGEDLQPFTFQAFYSLEREAGSRTLKPPELYGPPKLLIRRVASTLIAAVDMTPRTHVLNTIYVGKPAMADTDLDAIAAYLNSKAVNFWFHHIFVFEDRLFPYARKSQLSFIPVDPRVATSEGLSEAGRGIREAHTRYHAAVTRLGYGLESLGVRFSNAAERYAKAELLLTSEPREWMGLITAMAPGLKGQIPDKTVLSLLDQLPGLVNEILAVESEVSSHLVSAEKMVSGLLGLSREEEQVIGEWAVSLGRKDWLV